MTTKQEQMIIKQKALAFAWRLVYEGLGLSGYSPKATAAMRVIDCAKSDSTKGWRVAKSVNLDPVAYDYAFKIGGELPSNNWREASGPQELVNILGDETNLTIDIARELIQSAAVLKTYKRIETEGLSSIDQKSGYFKFIQQGIIQGSLRRIGQGDVGGNVPDPDSAMDAYVDEDYDPSGAPGKSLPELLVERELAAEINFSPLAELTQKIAVAHQQIRMANNIILERENSLE